MPIARNAVSFSVCRKMLASRAVNRGVVELRIAARLEEMCSSPQVINRKGMMLATTAISVSDGQTPVGKRAPRAKRRTNSTRAATTIRPSTTCTGVKSSRPSLISRKDEPQMAPRRRRRAASAGRMSGEY
jgi:hypothetical protein